MKSFCDRPLNAEIPPQTSAIFAPVSVFCSILPIWQYQVIDKIPTKIKMSELKGLKRNSFNFKIFEIQKFRIYEYDLVKIIEENLSQFLIILRV